LKKTSSLIGKILAAILILFVFSTPFILSASATSPIPAATYFLSPSRIQGTAGQNVTITLEVQGVTKLAGWQVGLIWSNPSVAKCTKVTNGSALDPYVSGVDYVYIPGKINNTAGYISVYTWSLFSTATPPNLNGSQSLAVFTFQMLQTGYADVHLNNMFTIDPLSNTIPMNVIDYTTIVRSGTQYIVKLEGNPVETSGTGGFDPVNVTTTSQTIKGVLYNGSLTFGMNGTSDDCGPFAYFNATIPNSLMSCTSSTNWVVEVNGVQQTGVIVNTGAQNTTISLSSTSDSSFAYSTYGSGILTQHIVILSNSIGAIPEFASMFSSIVLATLLVLAAFAAALLSITQRLRKRKN
jgi:hypothetical protein